MSTEFRIIHRAAFGNVHLVQRRDWYWPFWRDVRVNGFACGSRKEAEDWVRDGPPVYNPADRVVWQGAPPLAQQDER